MTSKGKDISKYYDAFSKNQESTGVNLRHITIFNKLKNLGLRHNSSVLEIGCGIGTVTGLIAKYCKNGKVVAVDISEESISKAKKRLSEYKQVEFLVHDMANFNHELTFDFVLLPDVMEHIPVANHKGLFEVLKKHTNDNSIILINIPHPHYLEWVHENHPEQLQVIDQPIYTDTLLNNAYSSGFYLETLEPHSLYFNEHDYQFIVFKQKKSKHTFTKRKKLDIISTKLKRSLG